MDTSFTIDRSTSANLNPYGTELVPNDLTNAKTFPGPRTDKIVLSTPQESIHLSKDNFDETLLRNILYCYNFLDSSDKQYVNSAEAELLIRQVKDENPTLFDLLYEVLQVVSDSGSSDVNIAKNLFINRLKSHVASLRPDDASSIHSLKTPVNAVSEYFRFNPRRAFSAKLVHVQHDNETYRDDGNWSKHCSETVFHPRESKPTRQDEEVAPNSTNSVDNVNKFDSLDEYLGFLNSSSSVNEFIVFNYRTKFDWQDSLRELTWSG